MSLLDSRLTRRTALVAGGSGALVAAGATVASADPAAPAADAAHRRHLGTVVDVTLTEAGFRLPRAVRAGVVTFRITSPEETYHALQGFTLQDGATLPEVIEAIRAGVGDDRAAAAAAHRMLLEKATLIGGAVGISQQVISVTVVLDPGTYYFVDYADYFAEGRTQPRVHELRVVGRRGRVQLPGYDETILAIPMDHEHMETESMTFGFVSPRVLPRRGRFLMINASDEIHDIGWRHAKPGTTDAYLREYYAAVLAGQPLPGPSPWLEPNLHGLQGVSPWRYAVVGIEFAEPGDYALVCYVPSDETGIPHTLEGMHLMTTLR
jgi:hypothetical protein